MQPVGADHDVSLGRAAVGETKAHTIAEVIHAGAARVEPDALRRQRVLQHRVQIGTVRAEIAGAVLRAEHAAHLRRRHDAAGLPVAHDVALRLECHRLEGTIEAERDEHAHGVGAELNAGADLAQRVRLLVDRDVEAMLAKRDRRVESTKARTDHRDLLHLPHAAPIAANSRSRGSMIADVSQGEEK